MGAFCTKTLVKVAAEKLQTVDLWSGGVRPQRQSGAAALGGARKKETDECACAQVTTTHKEVDYDILTVRVDFSQLETLNPPRATCPLQLQVQTKHTQPQ